jgi:hypothetical protein
MDDNDFPVDDSFACDVQRASNLGEALGPIQPGAGEDLLPTPVEMDLNAIAVVLDFMKPLVTVRCLRLQRRKLRLNEARYLSAL